MSDDLPEHRCPQCNKLLYKGVVMRVEIKCPRCKRIVRHEILNLRRKIKETVNNKRS